MEGTQCSFENLLAAEACLNDPDTPADVPAYLTSQTPRPAAGTAEASASR